MLSQIIFFMSRSALILNKCSKKTMEKVVTVLSLEITIIICQTLPTLKKCDLTFSRLSCHCFVTVLSRACH